MRRVVSAALVGSLAALTINVAPVFALCNPSRPFNEHSTDYGVRMDVNSTNFVGVQGILDLQIPWVEPNGSPTQPRLRLYGKPGDPENGLIQAFVGLVYYPGQGLLGSTGIRIFVSHEDGTAPYDKTFSIATYEAAEGIDIDGDGKVLLKIQQVQDPAGDFETFKVWADGTEIWNRTFLLPGEAPSQFKNIHAIATTGNDGSQVPGGSDNHYVFNAVRYIRTTGGTGIASGPLQVNGSFDQGPGRISFSEGGGVTRFETWDPACAL